VSSEERLVREAFRLLDSETYEQVLPLVDEDFEMVTTAEVASEPDVYRGPEGVRRWWTSFLDAMDSIQLEPIGFEDAGGGRVVVEFVIRARGRATGLETSQPAIALATAKEGKLLRLEFFTDLELARAAAQDRSG
jgi:ketosteroid isomerase-like protein